MGDPIINAQVDDINTTLGNIKVDLAALRPSIRAIKDAIAETYLTDTIENVPIASFNDGADDIPLRELEVAINPIQSLNGQTSPYPAGGGKNLYNASSISGQGSEGNYGIVATVSNGTITFNGTASDNAYFSVTGLALPAGIYTLSMNNPSGSNNVHVALRDAGGNYYSDSGMSATNYTKTTSGTRDLNSVIIYIVSGAQLTNFTIKPQLEVGSSATAYAPYSNICPISGHTEVNVVRTGKNLLPNLKALRDTKYVYLGQSIGTNDFYGVHLKAGTYTISCNNSVSASLYIKGSTQSSQMVNSAQLNNYGTVTLPIEDDYAIWLYRSAGITTDDVTQFQLEIGSSATLYEPYAGQTYPISLGQTVYGGTLNPITGVLTVDHELIDLGEQNWSYNTSGTYPTFAASKSGSAPSTGNEVCTCYKVISSVSGANYRAADHTNEINITSSNIMVQDPRYTDANAFKTAMSGQYLVRGIATPTTVQLTAAEVETLFGANNVWADSGNVVKLTYRKAWEIALAQGE